MCVCACVCAWLSVCLSVQKHFCTICMYTGKSMRIISSNLNNILSTKKLPCSSLLQPVMHVKLTSVCNSSTRSFSLCISSSRALMVLLPLSSSSWFSAYHFSFRANRSISSACLCSSSCIGVICCHLIPGFQTRTVYPKITYCQFFLLHGLLFKDLNYICMIFF